MNARPLHQHVDYRSEARTLSAAPGLYPSSAIVPTAPYASVSDPSTVARAYPTSTILPAADPAAPLPSEFPPAAAWAPPTFAPPSPDATQTHQLARQLSFYRRVTATLVISLAFAGSLAASYGYQLATRMTPASSRTPHASLTQSESLRVDSVDVKRTNAGTEAKTEAKADSKSSVSTPTPTPSPSREQSARPKRRASAAPSSGTDPDLGGRDLLREGLSD